MVDIHSRDSVIPPVADTLAPEDEQEKYPLPLALSSHERSSLQEKVHILMRSAILSGELRPGQRLIEHRLATHFGISRVPVREAIRRLEQEKLVVVSPRRAVTVSDISPSEAEETYVIRMALEGMAARLAAARATDECLSRLKVILESMEDALAAGDTESFERTVLEFHDTIIDTSGNRKLIELVNSVRTTIERYRRLYEDRVGHSAVRSREHHQIFQAIADRDGDRAERLIRLHLEGSLARLLSSFSVEDPE